MLSDVTAIASQHLQGKAHGHFSIDTTLHLSSNKQPSLVQYTHTYIHTYIITIKIPVSLQ